MKNLLISIIIILITSGSTKAQLNIDSLFLSADSLTLIFTGFFEDEHENWGFKQAFCQESAFHYSTNSKELISRTLKAFNFKESSDILFCGFDYEIYGFQNQSQIFKMLYNTDCNYGSIGTDYFWSDTLYQFNGLKEYMRFSETICEFRTSELLGCYLEALKKDERIELLKIDQLSDLKIYYRFKLKKI